jgi:hypothetical protein
MCVEDVVVITVLGGPSLEIGKRAASGGNLLDMITDEP